jgi:DNA-binding HxlR family transcriptional regulator
MKPQSNFLKSQINNISDDILIILKAMGNNKRLTILIQLLDGAKSFNNLMIRTKLQKTAISNHLNILIKTKLIEKPDYGLYQLTDDGVHFLRVLNEGWENSMASQVKKLHQVQSKKMSNSFLNNFFGR